ncbi:protein of unknown function [Pararobbsia alpina]
MARWAYATNLFFLAGAPECINISKKNQITKWHTDIHASYFAEFRVCEFIKSEGNPLQITVFIEFTNMTLACGNVLTIFLIKFSFKY